MSEWCVCVCGVGCSACEGETVVIEKQREHDEASRLVSSTFGRSKSELLEVVSVEGNQTTKQPDYGNGFLWY